MQLVEGKTLSYVFLLPLLYLQDKHTLSKHIKYIHNVYIGNDNTVHCTDVSNKAIYSPKIDTKLQSQYKLYLDGKYSKFEPYFKLYILKYWNGNQQLLDILFQTERMRQWWIDNSGYEVKTKDKEYWPKLNLKLELYV